MPTSPLGQLITFAIETDDDQQFSTYIWVPVRKGDTIQKVAARRGHPEQARTIADLNGIRSVRSKFSGRGIKRIRVPGKLRENASFSVLADKKPRIIDGYANLETVDRKLREGLTVPGGYNPLKMEVSVIFRPLVRGSIEGAGVMDDIELLEQMAGRGQFAGSASGRPPVIRVSTTNAAGKVIPLIPYNYQWSAGNKAAPLWYVAGIDWDENARSNASANVIHLPTVITLQKKTNNNVVKRAQSATR